MFLEDGLEVIARTEATLLGYGLDGVVWMFVHEFLGVVDAYGLNPFWVRLVAGLVEPVAEGNL